MAGGKRRVADGNILGAKDRKIFGKKPLSGKEGEARTEAYLDYVHEKLAGKAVGAPKLEMRNLHGARAELRSEMRRRKAEKEDKESKAA